MPRFTVHDRHASTAAHLRPKSTMVNPRYLVIDSSTDEAVDEFTTKGSAEAEARRMNAKAAESHDTGA